MKKSIPLGENEALCFFYISAVFAKPISVWLNFWKSATLIYYLIKHFGTKEGMLPFKCESCYEVKVQDLVNHTVNRIKHYLQDNPFISGFDSLILLIQSKQ